MCFAAFAASPQPSLRAILGSVRWVKRAGIVVLVLLNLVFGARGAMLQDQIDTLNAEMPEAYDDGELQGRVDDVEKGLNGLRSLILSDTPDDVRREGQRLVEDLNREFAYICAQFTSVECLSFPNGAGR